jgi:hypothetical protein
MAICDDVHGLQSEVLVNGQPLREYEDDEAEPNTTSKYIEESSDGESILRWKFSHPFPVQYGVEARMQVDGEQRRVEVRDSHGSHGL